MSISDSDLNIVMHARKSLLFSKKQPWVKRNGSEDFDVPMGCFDGAEICELVGTYILSKLSTIIQREDNGLYRDDSLGILSSCSGTDTERK